jgi:thiol-disulfide isomerase/thioredoxin
MVRADEYLINRIYKRDTIMKILSTLAVLALAVFVLPPQTYAMKGSAEVSPKLYAVTFHADWCGSCKALAPVIKDVRENANSQDVLFVKLDLTDADMIHQSKLMASSTGLWSVLKANGSKTGSMALIKADTGAEVARFMRDATADQITTAIAEHLK